MSETNPKAVMEMSRAELFAEAKRLGIETTHQMKNTDLIAVLEASFAAAANPPQETAPEVQAETPAAEPPASEAPAPTPDPVDPTPPSVEPEAAAVTEDEAQIVKSGFLKVKIRDFRGSFLDAKFDDNGVCERISEPTLRTLISEFPGANVVEYQEL